MAVNIADLFEHAVDAAPDNLAVKVGDRAATYAELERESNKLAHYLPRPGNIKDMRGGADGRPFVAL